MAEFPDLASKLNAPNKKSLFERQRAEAEAKKEREKAETAAVLAEFEKSFEDDDNNGRPSPNTPLRGAPAPGKRHFTSTGLKSGPGTLPRSGPGSLGPAFNKKRPFEEHTEPRERGRRLPLERRTSQDDEGREEEKAAKPTLHLASMPPNTSVTFIKGLFAHTPLNVDSVRILPHATSGSPEAERRSSAAIVTLAAETPASDIDTVVSHLQNSYLGLGFKLSISRHLSSTALGSAALASSHAYTLPFGARALPQQASLSRAPPPGQRFAPPQSYTSATPYSRGPPTQVTVQSPSDLKQLKVIHKALEALLTYGPEFEALLMSRADIQRDEKWAWLWDSSSIGGVYYRWRLWEILTNAAQRRKQRGIRHEILFEDQAAWLPPEEPLRFEYTTQLDEFVSDDDYNSSDEEADEGDRADLARRYNDHNAPGMGVADGAVGDGVGYLDPLAKAKLTHLLSRLPDSSSKLRRGDVARITAFAIEHAGAGGDEIATLITRNVVRPMSSLEGEDTTPASMVVLYTISDVLSCSASAGVRHAWRYRTLFEQALRQQKVFERLGRAEKDHKWGKLKGEKWKRSVQNLLSLWEGWSVFPQKAQEQFVEAFLNPPLSDEEQKAAAEAENQNQKLMADDIQKAKSTNRWRSVNEDVNPDVSMVDVDGAPMADDDSDAAIESGLEDIDGVSMIDSSDEEVVSTQTLAAPTSISGKSRSSADVQESVSSPGLGKALQTPVGRRQRPKAADMFADHSE